MQGAAEQEGRIFVKPGMIERRVTDSPDVYNRLGEGFKKLFIDNPAS